MSVAADTSGHPEEATQGGVSSRPFDGLPDLTLSVPQMRCAGCMSSVEKSLTALPGVDAARVNLSLKKVSVWGVNIGASKAIEALANKGYEAFELDDTMSDLTATDPEGRALLTRIAVAGFAMMNVMLLSVAVWSGASDATRDMFHWISAAIALPAVAYSAQPFIRHAWSALRVRRLNMDVPISLAIVLAAAMSLYETTQGGAHAYFDAALSLTFFLLAGRYLDHRTRRIARSAASELVALESHKARRITGDEMELVPLADLVPGDLVRLVPGERISVDGRIVDGEARIDRSLVTGESRAELARTGDRIAAGSINLDGQLDISVETTGEDTSLRRMAALVAVAEGARDRYTALADRAAAIYAPGVHLLALFAFVGWMVASGDLRLSLNIAIAVLIITCPCALGLAVPAVATAATGRLFRRGFLVRHSTALERLGEVDTVVFDKTGTLTRGHAKVETGELSEAEAAALSALARASSHPVSQAIAATLPPQPQTRVSDLREIAGSGVEAKIDDVPVRLGRAEWVAGSGSGTAFQLGDHPIRMVQITEDLRPGARAAVAALKSAGLGVHLLSGDRGAAVDDVAEQLGISQTRAAATPEQKIEYLQSLADHGARVLMVGDGLNDTGALAAAHASIAPASALEASRVAADVVLLREGLEGLPDAVATGRAARSRVRENFAIAAGYNMIAVPLALAGLATPLMAALAMSASSITVVLNALRVR